MRFSQLKLARNFPDLCRIKSILNMFHILYFNFNSLTEINRNEVKITGNGKLRC